MSYRRPTSAWAEVADFDRGLPTANSFRLVPADGEVNADGTLIRAEIGRVIVRTAIGSQLMIGFRRQFPGERTGICAVRTRSKAVTSLIQKTAGRGPPFH